jgi:predicted dehydrogenase
MAPGVLRFGFVGTGGMGAVHLREVHARTDARVAALCDVSEAALERAAAFLGPAATGVARFTDLGRMLAEAELDAVVVATPHTQHAAHVSACLDRGLHVLVEKPMATTAADARGLMAKARDTGRVLAIAYQRHGSGTYRRAHDAIQSGAVGDLRLITVLIAQDCLENFIPGRTWRADPALSGGGHFMDTGSHINDMMLWVSGLEPESVMAQIDNYGTNVDICTALAIRFRNGAVGTFAATALSPEWREEFSFYGSKGVLNIRDGEMRLHVKGQDPTILLPQGRDVRPVADFIATIRGEKPEPQAPAVYGLRVAQVSEAAYKSARSGRAEPVG